MTTSRWTLRTQLSLALLALNGLLAAAAPAQTTVSRQRPPGLAPLPVVSSARLYVIDCGTLTSSRPEEFNLTREEVADTNMIVTCFLVIHPKGILLFDTGLSDRLVGRPLYENYVYGYGQIKFNTLKGQLADIGVAAEDITYLALSHSHFDHMGNADDYAGSIWLTQKPETDLVLRKSPDSPLAHARREVIDGDHDVFGDGTVVLKSTPGHTPGHQSLFVKLAKTGSVVLSGDLYHYPEERTLHRMPPEELKTATPASRAMIDQFLIDKKAQLWIGHSIAFFKDAVKSPGWYE
jgi:N-acyl homoserine lactone hydrolase